MDKREFWATKPKAPTFQTVTFTHPAWAFPVRLVANVFDSVTLGGESYTPAPMSIEPPKKQGDAGISMSISFPRQVVGRIFKARLREIEAAGSREPIEILYAEWLGETDAPKVTWPLYVGDQQGVAFNSTTVQVTGAIDNPMRRQVAPIYDPAVFTGLQSA